MSRTSLFPKTLLFAAILGFGIFGWLGNGSATVAETGHFTEITVNICGDEGVKGDSRSPTYLKVCVDPPKPHFVTGEIDTFTIEVSLDSAGMMPDSRRLWNRHAKNPVIAWISAPRGSGIFFLSKKNPAILGNQAMVEFERREGDDSRFQSASVAYFVESDVRTGNYSIVLDIVGELVTAEGAEIQDAGIIKFPVEVDTHLSKKLLMLAIIGLAVFLFVVEWVRVDVVAILMMIILPELGLLNSTDAFRGLSSNAVIAIIGVMIISNGLNRTGLVDLAVQPLLKYVRTGPTRLVVVFSSMIAAISSVMQNTGAAVLFLPAIRRIAAKGLKIGISRVLMPIGMAAILGGTMTMIGTSPLILLNDILPKDMPKFGFVELTPIGLALVIGGILYLSIFGMRMLSKLAVERGLDPDGADESEDSEGVCCYPDLDGPFEIIVPDDYRSHGGPQEIVAIRRQSMVNIVAIASKDGFLNIAPHPKTAIRAGTALCVYGNPDSIRTFIAGYGLRLQDRPVYFKKDLFNPAFAGTVEMVVSPRSSFIGKTIKEIRFRETYEISALALHQDGKIYYRELADRSLDSGDIILIHGTWEQLLLLSENHQNFIIISPPDVEVHKPHKARAAVISFIVALVLMVISSFYFQKLAYNPIPLSLCLMVGAIGMVLSKVMTISEAYRAIDWRTVFLLAGLIPLGVAVEQTGTAQWLAKGIVLGLGDHMSPLILLIVLAVLSCIFTMVVSNVGACALLVPLGIAIAVQIGIDPRVAAIVVGIGVSNSFMLPTHQVNALYMGPGDYQTKDYLRIGGGLSVVYILILVTVVYLLYL